MTKARLERTLQKTSQISPAFSDGISQSCASNKAECFACGLY